MANPPCASAALVAAQVVMLASALVACPWNGLRERQSRVLCARNPGNRTRQHFPDDGRARAWAAFFVAG
ncbi:MAG: hypothetical protein OXI46_05930 [Gemmatimonadota bacterium]|nr:hypothetical protein [Gemmatimonadota bacterium]